MRTLDQYNNLMDGAFDHLSDTEYAHYKTLSAEAGEDPWPRTQDTANARGSQERDVQWNWAGGPWFADSAGAHGKGRSLTTKFVPKCRHKPSAVFEHEGVIYMGASRKHVEGESFNADDLVLCLLGSTRKRVLIYADDEWSALEPFARDDVSAAHHYLSIDWRDWSAPPVPPKFWQAFHDTVRSKGIKRVIVHCEGGHGRTGTALAALLMTLKKCSATDAADFIHTDYCKEAIESESQVEYLTNLSSQKP
jgi:hypothetical protein